MRLEDFDKFDKEETKKRNFGEQRIPSREEYITISQKKTQMLLLNIFVFFIYSCVIATAYNKTVLPQDPNTTLHQQFASVINPVRVKH